MTWINCLRDMLDSAQVGEDSIALEFQGRAGNLQHVVRSFYAKGFIWAGSPYDRYPEVERLIGRVCAQYGGLTFRGNP